MKKKAALTALLLFLLLPVGLWAFPFLHSYLRGMTIFGTALAVLSGLLLLPGLLTALFQGEKFSFKRHSDLSVSLLGYAGGAIVVGGLSIFRAAAEPGTLAEGLNYGVNVLGVVGIAALINVMWVAGFRKPSGGEAG